MHYSFETMAGNTILGSARQVGFFLYKWESSNGKAVKCTVETLLVFSGTLRTILVICPR